MDANPPEHLAEGQQDSAYNRVFENLVDRADPNEELIGLVAYGLYKIAKREWVMDYMSNHQRKPDDPAHQEYARSQTQSVLDGYTSRATEIVATYANSVVESERAGIERDALRGTFFKAVLSSFVGSFAFAAALALLFFIISISGPGFPTDFLNRISQSSSSSVPDPMTPAIQPQQ